MGDIVNQSWVVRALLVAVLAAGAGPVLANQPPVARNDQVKVNGTAFVVVDVLANDSDVDGDILTVTLPVGVEGLTNLGGGLLKFQPGACLQEDLSVTYQVEDAEENTASATLTLATGGCGDNRPPIAHPDPCYTSENVPCVAAVLSNDIDPDGDPLFVDRVVGALHGTAAVSADGLQVEFLPDPGYSGTDAGVRYWASDGLGGESDAWVYVSISNAPPGQGLLDNTFVTERDKLLAVGASSLVGDDRPAGHIFISASSPLGDRVEIIEPPGAEPMVLFFPPAGYLGERRFEYVARSPPPSGTLGTAEVVLQISQPVGSMQAADDVNLRTVQDGCMIVDQRVLVANDLYSGQSLPNISQITPPLMGSTTIIPGTNGQLLDYQPPTGYSGMDMLKYQVWDSLPGTANFDTATVVIAVQQPTAPGALIPVAQPDWALSANNQYVNIPVLNNDYDPDCSTLQIDGFPGTTALGGIVTLNAGDQLRYQPAFGAAGMDVFNYRVRDTAGNTALGTVTVEVNGQVYPPCPRFDYRDCADIATCVLNATASRASNSPLNSCTGAPWSFAQADYWLHLSEVNGPAPTPHPGFNVAGAIRADRSTPEEAWFPLNSHYAQPGLHRADLTLYEPDPGGSSVLTATGGRWVPVGGTTDEWTIGHLCVNSSCSFWPEGNWVDGVVDRFEWFYEGIQWTTGCNGLQCGLAVPNPDAVTTDMEAVAHAYTSLAAGASFEVNLWVYLFDRPNAVELTLTGTIPTPPPSPPTALQASNALCAADGPLLNWVDQAHTEDGFVIYRGINGGPLVLRGEVAADETEYQDFYPGPRSDQLSYRVMAFNDGGESPPAEVIGRPTPADCSGGAAPPLAPSDLAADPPSGGVRLYWLDNSAQESGFRIYRQDPGGTFQLQGTAGTNVETYYDALVPPNATYTYRVAAFNGLGETTAVADLPVTFPDFFFADSFESGDTTAWTLAVGAVSGSSKANLRESPTPTGQAPEVIALASSQTLLRPSELRAGAFRQGGVDLLWQDNATSEDGFRVLRKDQGDPYGEIALLPPGATAYFDTPVEPGTQVRYRIEAFDAAGKKKSGVLRVKVPRDVFQDSFETGDLRHWSHSVDPNGRLHGSFSSSLFGNRGLEVSMVASAPGYADADAPAEEVRTRARVLIDTRRVIPPAGLADEQPIVTFFRGVSEGGAERYSLRLIKQGAGLAVDAVVHGADGSVHTAPPAPLDGRVYSVEVDWDARGANGLGRFRLWLDGKLQALLESWPSVNSTGSRQTVGRLLLGAVELAAGAGGSLSLDEVSLRRGGGKIRRKALAGQVLAEGFEASEAFGWTSFTQGGGAHLVPASLEGAQALEVQVSGVGSQAYLERTLRYAERHLLASVLVDASALTLPQDETVTLLSALDSDTAQAQVELRLKQTSEGLKAVARSRDGTGWSSKRLALSPGVSRIELEWRSATSPGAADGSLVLQVSDEATDDTSRKIHDGLATGAARVKSLRVGITEPAATGVSGSVKLDALEVWR